MKELTYTFSECETHDNLDDCLNDIYDSGGDVINSDLNEDAEEGIVVFKVEDETEFLKKFITTESHGFSSLL